MVSARRSERDASHRAPPWRPAIEARLNRNPPELRLRDRIRPAAVLVPIVERDAPALLLTLRTEHLPTHAGQVCFPGGRFNAQDESLTATALREFEEEIGIAASSVELAGYLDFFETANSGFLILPVVGFLPENYKLNINAREVAEAFEVPLAYLADPKNRGSLELERGGVMRQFVTIQYGPHTIWGATAAMIADLSERLREK